MDVCLINPFLRATERVFELMVGVPVCSESPRVFACVPGGERFVNAVILMDNGETGGALLRFPPNVVFPIATSIAGPRLSLQDAYDAIGELANMVVGNAKRDLSQKLIHISVPRITVGERDLGDVAALTPWLDVPLTTPLGRFFLSISIQGIGDATVETCVAYEGRCDSAGRCVATPQPAS